MNLIIKNILIVLVILTLTSCKDSKRLSGTPTKYKYRINGITKAKYTSDTTAIRGVLAKMLDNQVKPLDLKAYDKETHLFIDSLVYSPNQLRMIVFVIVRNSSTKLLRQENDSTFYYDAYYLFCSRESLIKPIQVYDYSGYRLSFFYDYTEIREALREYCFSRMMRKERDEQYYNIDDKRFWSSKYFERVLSNSTPTSDDR